MASKKRRWLVIAVLLSGCGSEPSRKPIVKGVDKCESTCHGRVKRAVVNWSGFLDLCECHPPPPETPK